LAQQVPWLHAADTNKAPGRAADLRIWFSDFLVFTARRGRMCPQTSKLASSPPSTSRRYAHALKSTEAYADLAAADELPTIS
jgi:hypothetical protein